MNTYLPTTTVTNLGDKVISFVNILLIIAGILTILFIMYAGLLYITSGGNDNRVRTAKSSLTWSIIGLVVILLSLVIVNLANGIIQSF